MGVVLNTNTASLLATRALRSATQVNNSTVSKLATGKRINRGADDAAGLSINEKLTSKLRGIVKAEGNIGDGLNLVEMTAGRLNVAMEIRESMVKAFNGTNSGAELDAIQEEINASTSIIDKMSEPVPPNSTVWGDSVLRGATATNFFTKDFQVGSQDTDIITVDFSDNTDPDNTIDLTTFTTTTTLGGLTFGATVGLGSLQIGAPNVSRYFNAPSFVKAGNLNDLDIYIKNLTRMISVTDKYHARFTAAYDKLQEDKLSYSGFQSQVQDADYAKTASDYTKDQIRQNTAASMATQANAQVGFALNLLP
jgi:flagellin